MDETIFDFRKQYFTRKEAIENTKDGVLTIPEGKTILDSDFAYFLVREDLPRVRRLEIPSSVTTILSMGGDPSCGPFGYRNNPFCEIVVDPKNPNYMSKDGVLFTKDEKTLICYPCGKPDLEYRVPKNTEKIEHEAFLNTEHLQKIHFPKSLMEVERGAFSACLDLDFPELMKLYRQEDSYILAFHASNIFPMEHTFYLLENDKIAVTNEQIVKIVFDQAAPVKEHEERIKVWKTIADLADPWNADSLEVEVPKEIKEFFAIFFSPHN